MTSLLNLQEPLNSSNNTSSRAPEKSGLFEWSDEKSTKMNEIIRDNRQLNR